MNDNDEKTILRIIHYCDKIDSHIDYFGMIENYSLKMSIIKMHVH